MLIAIDFNKYMNSNVLVAFIVILAFLIAFFVGRLIVLKKYESENKKLSDQVNAVKASPNLFYLNRVKNMIYNDADIAERYELLSTQYDSLMSFLNDEVSTKLVEFDQSLFYRKIGDARKQYKELVILVDKLDTDSTNLQNDLERIIEIDSKQRNFNIELQNKYRTLEQDFESIKYKVDDVVPNLGISIYALEDDFTKIGEYLNEQKYTECRQLGDALESKIDFLANNVRDLPTYISLTENLIPEQISALEKRQEKMDGLGFALNNLNVSNRIFTISELLKFVKDDIRELKIELVGENIEKLNTAIKELNTDLDAEEAAKGEYVDHCTEIFGKVSQANEYYTNAVRLYKQLEEKYVIADPKMDLDVNHPMLERINDDLDAIKKIISTKDFAYKDVMEKLNNVSNRCDQYLDTLKYFFDERQNMQLKEKRAKDELKHINLVLLKVKSEIKNSHLPSISDDYMNYINQSYDRAAEIQKLCSNYPIDLAALSAKTDEAINIINRLSLNVHHLTVTAQMVEETIVAGNRYRSEIIEVNNALTQAELYYRNGEYSKALTTSLEIMDKIDPGYVKKLIEKNDPTK